MTSCYIYWVERFENRNHKISCAIDISFLKKIKIDIFLKLGGTSVILYKIEAFYTISATFSSLRVYNADLPSPHCANLPPPTRHHESSYGTNPSHLLPLDSKSNPSFLAHSWRFFLS